MTGSVHRHRRWMAPALAIGLLLAFGAAAIKISQVFDPGVVIIALIAVAILLVIGLAVTQDRARRQTLRQTSHIRELIANVPALIFLTDGEGRLTEMNPAFARAARIDPDKARGHTLDEVLPPELLAFYKDSPFLRGASPMDEVLEMPPAQAGKAERFYRLIRFPIKHNGSTNGASGTVAFNITDRVQAALALQELNRNLEQKVAERTRALVQAKEVAEAALQTKANFLASMSHEIRTPLSAILGLAHLARKSDPERMRDYLEKIQHSGQHLLTLINGILDFSKLEAGKIAVDNAPFSLSRLLESSADFVREQAREKGLALHVEQDPSLADSVVGDSVRISQILINFLSNAVKFTHTGSVVLRALSLPSDPAPAAPRRTRIRLEVADTGIGIASDQMQNLFQPFSQLDKGSARAYEGTGLGLAISKDLADLLRGEIRVDSAPGSGSIFALELTLEAIDTGDRPVPATATDAATDSTAGFDIEELAGRRVLLAEDNPINREVAVDVLTSFGLDVTEAVDGIDAVNKASSAPFDLVLMDVQMPRLDGYGAAQRIRAQPHLARLPIVAMTANALQGDRERCLQVGMNDYLAKPFQVSALLATLQRWLPPATAVRADYAALRVGGFYIYKALSYLAGRDALYLKVLQRFHAERGDLPAQLRTELAAGRAEAAMDLVHALKSLAGTLGADELQTRSETLELCLRDGQRCEAETAAFVAEFQRVWGAVDTILGGAPAVTASARSAQRTD